MNIYKLIKEDRLEEFCIENNIIMISHLKFEPITRGFGYYSGKRYYVLLNPQHNIFRLRLTLIHELIHVFESHFDSNNCEEVEAKVDCIIEGLKSELKEYFIYYWLVGGFYGYWGNY